MKFIQYLIALYIRFKGRPGALKKAMRKADRQQRRYKKRFRVYFLQNRYQALSRTQIQWKKRKGEWAHHVNVTKMEPLEYYDTLEGIKTPGHELLGTRNSKI